MNDEPYFWGETSYLHSVGLAAASLTIRKAGCFALPEDSCDQRLDSELVDVVVGDILVQTSIKGKAMPLCVLGQVNFCFRLIDHHRP